MKFFALNYSSMGDSWVEIEISLIPGLPRFSIIGLPDTALKEGILRIKSALLMHGFQWPNNKEVIVNLKPINNKKWNQNIELAILICFLYTTNQICLESSFDDDDSLLVLGDLDLRGNTTLSNEFHGRTFLNWTGKILTGFILEPLLFDCHFIKNIGQLKKSEIKFQKKQSIQSLIQRPKVERNFYWSEEESRLIMLLALGSFSAFLAGAKGSGKTSLVKEVWRLLPEPCEKEFEEMQKQSSKALLWRPMIAPHHSTPKVSLIGGGVPLRLGEVAKAHGGLMVLDEFLEFKRDSIEVLREAMQSEEIEIARLGQVFKCKTRFQVLATTNVCPCGKWSGHADQYVNCSRSLRVCKSYINRMVGPVLDRFHILWIKPYRSAKNAQTIGSEQMLELLQNVRVYRAQKPWGKVPYDKLNIEQILSTLSQPWLAQVYVFDGGSERRKLAFWQVARALADLDQLDCIEEKHIKEAYKWSCLDFRSLE